MKKFEAVFFDKDGVIIDSFLTVLTAVNKTREHYGLPIVSRERFLKDFWGNRGDLKKNAFGAYNEKELEERAAYFRDRRKELEYNSRLYPSVLKVLKELKGKYKIGLITNTSREIVEKILNDFKIVDYFDVTVCGDEAIPKPSPDPISKACKIIGAKPSEILYIGDMEMDIKTGKSAGCTTVIVTTSKNREEFEDVEGIIIIDSLEELLEIL